MDEFITLEQLLCVETRPPATQAPDVPETPPAPTPELDATLSEVRRFRAALADALDASLDRLLCDVAADVIGRELQLSPCDIVHVARSALQRHDGDAPLRLRAHPDDVCALADVDCDVAADEHLRRGDLTIELRCGTIDATLGARLETVLAACTSR
ncbi:MAG: hypothetical protein JO192_09930 [Candidatus Eremiobacteraeota bacterium]|nr:hypothetical protein [Candidatus Eremiobacteraeota bacterium]MBV8722486.1 hypothetical protein [Candidatus Eremiobacteraeota bacterium]